MLAQIMNIKNLASFSLSLSIASSSMGITCEISSENNHSQILEAIHFAKKHHEGQFRKFDGLPYFTHPIRVAKIVKQYTEDSDLIIAAYLHDLIEDTKVTKRWIKKKFGKRVANIVNELSSDSSKIEKMGSKAEYLASKMQKMSLEALLIKLSDRLDNVSDFEAAKINFIINYRAETNYILSKVSRREDLLNSHKSLISRIYKAMHDGEKLYQAKVFGQKNFRNLKNDITEAGFIFQATKVSALLAKRSASVNHRSVVYLVGVPKYEELSQYLDLKRNFGTEIADLVEELNSNISLNQSMVSLSDEALNIRLAGILENLNEIFKMEALADFEEYIQQTEEKLNGLKNSERDLSQDHIYFIGRINIVLDRSLKKLKLME